MKIKIILLFMIAVCAIALALPGTVKAQALPAPPQQTITGSQLVLGDNYSLKSGQTLDGSLVVLGGNAIIEKGAKVTGDIALLGGNLDFSGEVNGSINFVGGNVTLRSGSIVRGDINSFGGNLEGEQLATIYGQVHRLSPRAFVFNPSTPTTPTIPQPGIWTSLGDFFGSLLSKALKVLGMAVLALVLGLIIAKPLDRVAHSFSAQPWLSVGSGFLTALLTPIVLVLLSITIILIPFTLLAFIVLGIALLFGWVAVGFEVGKRMADLFKATWAEPVSAGLGTLVLGVAVWLLSYVPCIGWLAGILVASLGLGGVILSKFGTQYYTTRSANPPAEPITVSPSMATPAAGDPTAPKAEPGKQSEPEKSDNPPM